MSTSKSRKPNNRLTNVEKRRRASMAWFKIDQLLNKSKKIKTTDKLIKDKE